MHEASSKNKLNIPADEFEEHQYAEISDTDNSSPDSKITDSESSIKIHETEEYDNFYVEQDLTIENGIDNGVPVSAEEGYAETETYAITDEVENKSQQNNLKSASASFKSSLKKISSSKSKQKKAAHGIIPTNISLPFSLKEKKKKAKEEKTTEISEKTDESRISGRFKEYHEILTNLFKKENTESEEYVFQHAEYPERPEIEPGLLPDTLEVLDSYWLYPPHSFAVIVTDKEKNRQYMVFEPKITEKERIILEETDAQLRSVILYDSKTQPEGLDLNSTIVYRIIKNLDENIEDERIDIIRYYLRRNFNGYGKLDPLMNDEGIEDITCNGPDIPVFIFHRKYSNLPVNIIFEGNELNKFVLKIAQKADKQLSLTAPLVDAALPEGARAQITYTDVVSSKGSSFTIRKFKSDPMTPVDLIDYGTYDAEILAFIWLCVENRKSAIVVGGTASGKTSMMNAFSLFIPHLAKIVSIEDTREIQMPHKNWLPMKTRESVSESGKGNVDMFSLLKSALRQRPEYIIVGEVRGSEAQTLFQAMNTGHTTYSTLHAGGVEQAINRLTTNPINVPVAMFGALDLMIIQQLQYIGGRMVRRCITIDEIVAERGDITYNVLYKWNPVKDNFRKICKESKIISDIAYSHGWTIDETLRQIDIRKDILEGLLKHGIRSSDEITAVFDEFAKSGTYEFEG